MSAEQRHLRVAVGDGLAFAHYHTRIVNAETKQSATCGWVRVTVCLERPHLLSANFQIGLTQLDGRKPLPTSGGATTMSIEVADSFTSDINNVMQKITPFLGSITTGAMQFYVSIFDELEDRKASPLWQGGSWSGKMIRH